MTTDERLTIWETLPDPVKRDLVALAEADDESPEFDPSRQPPPLDLPLTDFILKIVRELAATVAADQLTTVHAQESDLIPKGHIIIGTGPATEEPTPDASGGGRD